MTIFISQLNIFSNTFVINQRISTMIGGNNVYSMNDAVNRKKQFPISKDDSKQIPSLPLFTLSGG